MEEKNYFYLESGTLRPKLHTRIRFFIYYKSFFKMTVCTTLCVFFYELILNLCEVSDPSLNLIKEKVNMIGISCSHSLQVF